MKYSISYILFFLFSVSLFTSCKQNNVQEPAPDTEIVYDSALAASYGADDYGMKKYVVAFLVRGKNQSIDSLERARLQEAHLQNIFRLADEGKLVLAGPFFGNDALRGIYIFDVQSIAEAEALTATDPSIQAGLLAMDLKEWYGSAALVGVNNEHKKLSRKTILQSD